MFYSSLSELVVAVMRKSEQLEYSAHILSSRSSAFYILHSVFKDFCVTFQLMLLIPRVNDWKYQHNARQMKSAVEPPSVTLQILNNTILDKVTCPT
jgi:hypothetical protein